MCFIDKVCKRIDLAFDRLGAWIKGPTPVRQTPYIDQWLLHLIDEARIKKDNEQAELIAQRAEHDAYIRTLPEVDGWVEIEPGVWTTGPSFGRLMREWQEQNPEAVARCNQFREDMRKMLDEMPN